MTTGHDSHSVESQFLPQDKVVEFARMDPFELLIATEKAVGDSSLYKTHVKLIEGTMAAKQLEAVRVQPGSTKVFQLVMTSSC